RARQLARMLPAEEAPAGWNENELVRAAAHRGARQAFHQQLAVVARAMLDRDQQMMLVPEAVFEALVADQLDHFGAYAAPARGAVPDDVGGEKIDRQRRCWILDEGPANFVGSGGSNELTHDHLPYSIICMSIPPIS